MIQGFNQIRRKFAYNNQPVKYLRYAIGEIILIMAGILLAMQLNNWNEARKKHTIKQEYFENLLTSLQKDSTELISILNYQNKSLRNQERLINSTYTEFRKSFSDDEINILLRDILNGQLSFFPKYGTYNMIISNEGLSILKSNDINADLIELYDYKFKRYTNIDDIVDQKFKFGLLPFLHRKLGFFSTRDSVIKNADHERMETNYSDLVNNCQDLYGVTARGRDLLIDIQNDVNELILQIRGELFK